MLLKKRFLFSVLLIFLWSAGFAQKPKEMAIVLKRQIERNHYSPRPVNDSFSSDMFSKILKGLDPQQTIFTSEDYTTLSAYRYKLDDELNGYDWTFLDKITGLYRQRLKRADSLVESILKKPLDLNVDEKISFSKEESFQFAPASEQPKRWAKWFRFLMLNYLYDICERDSTKPSMKTVLAKNETSLREKIKKHTQKNLQETLDPATFENHVTEIYLNALATSFDPHTMFFSPQDKESFQSGLSTEEYSFGFNIDETNEGKIIVAQLIPGGPAWKSGELHVNDELLQLQWEGKAPVEVSGITIEEAGDLLNQAGKNNLSVKVRKANGAIRTVLLQKEKIETEENVVKGYVLKGEKNIGYISLPDFYTTWEDEKGSGCANDLAKEILKLKREKIEGLIVDVRFNGGGSLEEALQMAGIFIDEGPLTGTKERNGKLVFLKDPNRGTVYDGPLVLLVNGQSASASEMLAAVLQDYNRAVIVGSSTYGKATMQQIFPLDTMMRNPNAPSQNGYVKITTGKLYRVSGQTAQLNGVKPDIILPDVFDMVQYGERFSKNALPSDTVKRNAYYKSLSSLPLSVLQQLSDQRMNSNKNFQAIREVIQLQSQEKQEMVVPLKLELFEKWASQNKKEEGAMNEEKYLPTKLFIPQNYKTDTQTLPGDTYTRTIDDIILKNILKDIYIEEAYQVLSDLIKMQTHKNE